MNSVFGPQTPSSVDQWRQNLEMQQAQLQKMQQAQQSQQGSTTLLEEFKANVAALSQDEQQYLMSTPEFTQAKNIYEQGFMEFLSSRFSGEYLATPVGKQAIENLNETCKHSIKTIKDAARERNQRLEALARLAEEDPEIQKKLQEKMING